MGKSKTINGMRKWVPALSHASCHSVLTSEPGLSSPQTQQSTSEMGHILLHVDVSTPTIEHKGITSRVEKLLCSQIQNVYQWAETPEGMFLTPELSKKEYRLPFLMEKR